MYLFDFLTDSKKHGIKVKIALFLSKHKIWTEENMDNNLSSFTFINAYNRLDIAKDFLNRNYNYVYEETLRLVNELEVLDNIAKYIDFLIPRHYFIKKGNKKDDYNGIKAVKEMKYAYEESYILDENMYGDNESSLVDKYKKEYIEFNRPYSRLTNEDLFNLLMSDISIEGYYLNPKYSKPFNRLTMLKLLHHFYYNKEYDKFNEYIFTRDEYYTAISSKKIDEFIIDKEIEIGDFVIPDYIKYEDEVFEDILSIGEVYNKSDGEFKVYYPSCGLGEWFLDSELKVLNINLNSRFVQAVQDLFEEDDIEF